MSLELEIALATLNGESFLPKIETSLTYKHWLSVEDFKRCVDCAKTHGKVWNLEDIPYPEPPIHLRCRCSIETMKSILAGTATSKGINGTDWWLKEMGTLPDYYINKSEAKKLGYDPLLGNLAGRSGKMVDQRGI